MRVRVRVRVRVRSAPILTDVLDVPAARHEHAVRLAVHLTRRADGGRDRLQDRAQHKGAMLRGMRRTLHSAPHHSA